MLALNRVFDLPLYPLCSEASACSCIATSHTLPAPSRNAPQAGSHVRRFFFVDDTLATPEGGAPRAIVYPSSMTLQFTIRADRRHHITPPLLSIT